MSHRRIARCRPRPALELLECRALLSGNVTATVSGDTLRIRGDAADNAIQLVQPFSVGYSALGGDDAGAGRLFAVPDDGTNSVVELDPATGAEVYRFPAPEPVSQGPDGLAFDGTSLFYINGFGSQQLWELDPDTGAVIDADPVTGGSGSYDGLAALGGKVYVLDYGASDIIEFDPASDVVTKVLDVDALNPGTSVVGGLAGIAGPDALIATVGAGASVVEIDPATGLVTHSFVPASPPYYGVAVVDGTIYLGSPAGFIDVYSRGGALQKTVTAPTPLQLQGVETLINGRLQTLTFDVAPANVDVQLGAGGDRVLASNVTLPGKLSVTDAGTGNDSVEITSSRLGALAVSTAGGLDAVSVYDVAVGGSLSVDTGAGDDVAQVYFTTVQGSLGVTTGAGKDSVDAYFDTAGSTSIDTGGDDDSLSLHFLTTGSLRASAGAGYDVARVGSVQDTSGTGLIDGGANTDVFVDDGSNTGFKKKNFP